ncbi:hypothetical protein BOTNAR_0322g00070 [Botryotinia narcissicola]|uniref:Uncharacterized protein n=1 Tax=Botryotinia narcissicola TaxID=278944 RepID=A0A4Z1HUQ1_9HELO|nr:hypothetical protein BOTNAR_0322g00070 [Botryotinia narcissicola]
MSSNAQRGSQAGTSTGGKCQDRSKSERSQQQQQQPQSQSQKSHNDQQKTDRPPENRATRNPIYKLERRLSGIKGPPLDLAEKEKLEHLKSIKPR